MWQAVPDNKGKSATFKGLLIAIRNKGCRTTLTLRNHLGTSGAIEQTFPLYVSCLSQYLTAKFFSAWYFTSCVTSSISWTLSDFKYSIASCPDSKLKEILLTAWLLSCPWCDHSTSDLSCFLQVQPDNQEHQGLGSTESTESKALLPEGEKSKGVSSMRSWFLRSFWSLHCSPLQDSGGLALFHQHQQS